MANYQSNYTGTQIDAGISAISATTDYVVEQGVTDGWTWRKWNNGIAECWCQLTKDSHVSSPWGNFYESLQVGNVPYPFTFMEIPMEFVSPGNNSVCGWVEVSSSAIQTVTNTNFYQFVSPTKITTTQPIYVNMYVRGKWK